jgi:hypothetical protein
MKSLPKLLNTLIIAAALDQTYAVTITSQPNNKTVNKGQSASFSVIASGAGTISYQWQKDGFDIPGANLGTYTIANCKPWHIGAYTVKVTDSNSSLSSNLVSLDLNNIDANLWRGLTAYYPLDDSLGDSSILQKTLALNNGAFGPDRFNRDNKSIELSGDSSYISASDVLSDNITSFTWSLWFKPYSLPKGYFPGNPGLVGFALIESPSSIGNDDNSPYIILKENRSVAFATFDSVNGGVSGESPANLWAVNEWSQLVVVGDLTNHKLRLYMNGSLIYQMDLPSYGQRFNNLLFGADRMLLPASQNDVYFDGALDDIRIYNRALSASEVQALYATEANQQPTLTNPGNQTIFENAATNVLSFTVADEDMSASSLVVSASSSDTTLVPNANIVLGGSGGNRTVRVTPAVGQTGTATITLNVSDGTANSTASFQLTVLPTKPLFTLNPEGERAVNPNSPATFTATYVAGVQPFTYRWRRNGTTISGATASSYIISSVQQSHEGSYDCVITNSFGSFTTPATNLTVTDPVVIVASPLNRAANLDEEVFFSVKVTGTEPIEYQWRKNGAELPGGNASSLTFITGSDSGGFYDVVVTNPLGSVTSAAAVLTVLVPPVITVQPSDQNVSAGATAFFSVTASGPGLTYQWRRNGADLSKQTGPMLMVSNVQKANEGVYDVLVKNAFGAVLSDPAVLSLPQPLGISEHPQDVTSVPGDTATFTVTAVGQGTLTYQWNKDGKPIKDAKSSTLNVPVTDSSAAGAYTVTVGLGSLKVTSFPAFLRVPEEGLLIYKFTLTGNSYEGTTSSKIALSGLLVLDRLNQRGGIIRFGKNGKLNTFISMLDDGIRTNSTGPVMNSQTVVSKVVKAEDSPEQETSMLWLRGTDGLVTFSSTDKTMAPKTLSGFQTELSLAGYMEVTSLSLTATLDNAASLQARQAGETIEQTLNRLTAGLQQRGFIRE